MKEKFKVACVQNRAEASLDLSLEEVDELVRSACTKGAALVCLPEYFACFEVSEAGMEVAPYGEQSHPALPVMRSLAKEFGVWLNLGSLAIRSGAGRIRNRSFLIDPQGNITARYDKIHLFDVQLGPGETYRESDKVEAGDCAVVAPLRWGALGMSVCYDLRFGYLYRSLARAGASFLSIPAAFTRTTGEAHWHVLVRARAIETGCFVFAASQYGEHGLARTYGHSLIVDPWGNVLADAGSGRGLAMAAVDPALVGAARSRIPALEHERDFVMAGESVRRAAAG